jgi:hypothetical protein
MTVPKSCGACKQSFESDRDLQKHQQSAHQHRRDKKLPESDGIHGERDRETENIG